MTSILKVDPKAWFTSERTFLHWLNMSMVRITRIVGYMFILLDRERCLVRGDIRHRIHNVVGVVWADRSGSIQVR